MSIFESLYRSLNEAIEFETEAKKREEKRMRIGDEVYIHGFVDEIRKDTVIIRNKGGYFGTDAEEVMPTATQFNESNALSALEKGEANE